MHRTFVFGLLTLVWMTGGLGCVKRTEYDAKVGELQACSSAYGRCQKGFLELQQWGAATAEKLAAVQADLDARTQRANRDLAELQKQLDDATALHAGLRDELQRKGEDVDKLLAERGALAQSLEQAKARLEELRRAQAAAERRAEMMRQLVERFRKMADAGRLQVVVRRGRMVVQLPNDVLFDSGQAEVKPDGKQTLAEVAAILRDVSDRQFQVSGHTDDTPIQTARYPSNWYLSAARAIRVLEILAENGMHARALSACGYGEFDPVAPNDTPENKATNRRIEIVLQPDVSEFLAVGGSQGW